MAEPLSRPAAELLGLLRKDGRLAPTALFSAFGLSALGKVFEAVLWLGLFELVRTLVLRHQRLVATVIFMIFLLAMLTSEFDIFLKGKLNLRVTAGRHRLSSSAAYLN